MTREDFATAMCRSLPAGTVLKNPGRGTSTIVWIDDDRLCYQRGRARFYVFLADLHEAFQEFAGRDATTTDLKKYAPQVFDSAQRGHNCNCTVLFMALQSMGLAGPIKGSGRRGDPFGVRVAHGS